MVTVKDVALHAGVSMITVSRVVNGANNVGAQTRRRVEEAIDELNYVPNMVASNLRSSQSDLLALVLPDITNSFWTSIARGAEDEAWSRGFGVFICNTDNDLDKEAGYMERLIRRRVGGVLFVPTPFPESQAQLRRLRSHGVNFVVIHRPLDEIAADVVRTDGEWAAHRMTSELIRSGRKKIAYVGMPLYDKVSEVRLRGYSAALAEAGMEVEPDVVVTGEDNKETGAYRLVTDLMALDDRPDALLLANSRIALGGLQALRDGGMRIPEDVGVAVFHDVNALDHYAPQVIRAVQPSYEMGQLAARRLLSLGSAQASGYEDVVLKPEIHLPSPGRGR